MGMRLYFNANCSDCVRQAAWTNRLDWLNRVDLRTDESPLGKVPIGEIVVVDEGNKKVFTGVYAIRKVCLNVPVLYLYGLALYLPLMRSIVGRNKAGCNGDACEI